jgi:carboxyl-terminal processing protease
MKNCVILFSALLAGMLLFGAISSKGNAPEDVYRHLAVFAEVLSRIKSDYVEEPEMKSVTLGALNGLLESLDPYASYLSADQYKQYLRNKGSKKANVGLVLSKKYGYIGIVDAIPGSPAARAGLSTGDMIETVNNVSTRDMPLAYADLMLAGDAGTTVELSVLRFRRPEPTKMALVRSPIVYPSLQTKMLDDGVGYLQVQSLEEGKVMAVGEALLALNKQGANKLVLDLRDNAVGDPQDGITVANLFMEKGQLGYLMGQKHPRQDFDADPAKAIFKKPLVVITNRGTAAAAEVAAAALLESKRAEIVGERTYGDAALRKAVTLDDGSAVLLSVAKFYSPTGKAIQDVGVVPSVAVSEFDPSQLSDDDDDPAQPAEKKPGEDVLLKKALEVLAKGALAAGNVSTEAAPRPAGDSGMHPLNIPRPR